MRRSPARRTRAGRWRQRVDQRRGRVRSPPDLRLPSPKAGERWIVGAVIHDGTGRIFVQRRSEDRSLFPGAWDLVGGHLEPGEPILGCLAREVSEETGWAVERIV